MKKHLSVIVCCFLLGGCATSLDQNAGNTTYSEFIKQMNEKKSELDEE